MFSEVDQIIAVCQWVKDVLTCNGVDPQKITLCRQGITDQRQTIALNQAQHGSSLNIAFLGRLDPTKGVHILIQALRSLLSDPFRLVIYGVVHGEPGQRYERELRRLAAGDERIEFHSPIRTAEVVSTLRDFDLVAVPSQWLETGPLVVLEAFSAGVPVIGSRLGSIAETVRDGVDGILVPATSVEAWAQALLRLNRDRGLVELLRRGVKPPRSMPVVANEMAALYAQVHEDNVEYRFSTAAKSR
ncbi:MAG: hypothetical protein AUI36_43450 [Cyanobacteria bacterium 13_1_40CM_2_61_4]|nr:MAG: hypothetical protein AUI36_43450 [Cyanobacteria bacterium 13_1_40CM_2_61_4]